MKILALLRRNLATLLMLAFVAGFYSLLALPHHEERNSRQEIKKEERAAREELKTMEDRFRRNIERKPLLLARLSLFILLVLLLGLGFNVYFLVWRMSGGAGMEGGLPPGDVPWSFKDVAQVFALLFFAEAVILLCEMAIASFLGVKRLEKNFFLMLNSLLRDVVVAGFVILLVKKRYGRRLSDIGLTLKNLFKNIRRGVVGYVAVIPALLVIVILLAFLAKLFSYEPSPQPVVEIYLKETEERRLVFFTFFVAVVGPVIEEIFFRGFTYRAFRARWGALGGMLGSAALFAGLHMNLIAFLPIFFLGVFLAYLYEKTGSLVPSMTVHVLHNLIMVTLTLGFRSLAA